MSTLDEILRSTRRRVDDLRAADAGHLEALAAGAGPPRGFSNALRGDDVAVIGEIKRRSPSAGDIAPGADAGALAAAYESGGAAALSVLTEPDFFGGSLADLGAARNAASLPALRKDFVVDALQIVESRAHEADAVLLIARVVGDDLGRLLEACGGWSMDALVEVFDERDVEMALAAGADLVGVNNRDLTDFTVSLERTEKLAPLLPADVTLVALSGVADPLDVARMSAAGAAAVLVGGAAAGSSDPASFIAGLTA